MNEGDAKRREYRSSLEAEEGGSVCGDTAAGSEEAVVLSAGENGGDVFGFY